MWKNIKINNDNYMIYVIQKDGNTKIFLTNLIEIWMETLTNETILDRCRILNPLLNIEALNYNKIVSDIFNDMSKYIVEASVQQIKLRVQINDGSMKFNINLTKGTPQDFWEIITKPMCMSSMEIIRQREFLLDLVKKKDEEITEYKAEGAELIRRNIETKTFTEEQLKIDAPTPNIIHYTNAFQGMVTFYDTFNLCKYNTSAIKSSSLSHANDTNEDISMQSTIGSLKSRSDEQSKEVTRKEVSNKKSRAASMAYRPVKKLKKGLSDSIL